MRENLAREAPALLRAVRDRRACVALVLLVLVAVLMSPIRRSSTTRSRRPPQGLRRNFALPASESSRLPVSAWIVHEDAAVAARSETGEDDDGPSGAARQPDDPSLFPSRRAPARDLPVPGRLPAVHPLRC